MPTHVPVLVDDLFGELVPASEPEQWSVIHTKPRREKKLAEYACALGIHYYLPQMLSTRIYQRRSVTFSKPMFPGYLFAVVDPAKKQNLIISGHLVSFIKVTNQRELLEELQNIRLCRQPEVLMENVLWLSEGLKVEITDGPLKGVTGVVESHLKLEEVRLQVKILHQAVLVKVDPRNVRILGEYTIVESE
jgi:transcriptional antiterminator RfaH